MARIYSVSFIVLATSSLKVASMSCETHLIVLIIGDLGSLLGKADHDRPVAVMKGRLKLEINPILQARSLAIHEERGADTFRPHVLDRFQASGQQTA